MGYCVSLERMNEIIKELQKDYRVTLRSFEKRGRYSDTDRSAMREINRQRSSCTIQKSDFSPKEVFYPITQTLFYFTEDEYRESKADDRGMIIFARPCDINGIGRLDTIFLSNGQLEDSYYKQLRDKVKFFCWSAGRAGTPASAPPWGPTGPTITAWR